VNGFGAGVLLAATVTTGLMAGLYGAFFCAVMPGLARTDDPAFVAAMQRINEAILNGWFAVCFAGAPVLTAIAAATHLDGPGLDVLPWIIAGLVLYVATLVITFVANVPLNNALAAAGAVGDGTAGAARRGFEASWVRWNAVRAALGTAAFGCLCWALTVHGRVSAPDGLLG
jgi:uncharacterized membrane protein